MRGDKIEFNYNSEYTYHLPKKVFTTHEEIVMFFESLIHLYMGRPGKYFVAYDRIVNASKGDLMDVISSQNVTPE